VHTLVERNKSGFFISEEENQSHSPPAETFRTLLDLVNGYNSILVHPFSSSLAKEPAFHGDLTGEEAEEILSEMEDGSYLFRFSSRQGCLALSYIAQGYSQHAIVMIVPGGGGECEDGIVEGYRFADEDQIYNSLSDLIASRGTLFCNPCTSLTLSDLGWIDSNSSTNESGVSTHQFGGAEGERGVPRRDSKEVEEVGGGGGAGAWGEEDNGGKAKRTMYAAFDKEMVLKALSEREKANSSLEIAPSSVGSVPGVVKKDGEEGGTNKGDIYSSRMSKTSTAGGGEFKGEDMYSIAGANVGGNGGRSLLRSGNTSGGGTLEVGRLEMYSEKVEGKKERKKKKKEKEKTRKRTKKKV